MSSMLGSAAGAALTVSDPLVGSEIAADMKIRTLGQNDLIKFRI